MSSYASIILTTSLVLSLSVPGYSMLFNTPRNMNNATKRVSGMIWPILTFGITFAVFVRILQVTLPALPPVSSLFTTSLTSDRAIFSKGYSGPEWHAPRGTDINDLSKALDGSGPMAQKVVPKTGAGGSEQPEGWNYADYNYCNMPHVTKQEYEEKGEEWELVFVEVIQRHHKRTPYATSTFPHETYAWYCDDAQLYQFGRPNPLDRTSATGFWHIIDNDEQSMTGQTSKVNPFVAPGFAGTCQFPQITYGGLHDSWQHGKDLHDVYHDLLHIIPDAPSEADLADPKNPFHKQVRFRVTNNPITSQVAGMALNGMFGITGAYPLDIQPKAIDSLEPSYDCPRFQQLSQDYGPGSSFLNSPASPSRTRWLDHLRATAPLFARLDAISGVDPAHRTFHQSWDHYFDSLSSRLCHSKPIPCSTSDPDDDRCITQAEAEEVFRLGMWEYSHIYRDAPESLSASAASMGVWLAELSQHLKDAAAGASELKYMHNVAHDGSISRLLSALQVDVMVWPGLGSEIVFELFRKKMRTVEEMGSPLSGYHIRVLWSGRALQSSSPALGNVDMLPLEDFLGYVDGLVGVRASKVKEMCGR